LTLFSSYTALRKQKDELKMADRKVTKALLEVNIKRGKERGGESGHQVGTRGVWGDHLQPGGEGKSLAAAVDRRPGGELQRQIPFNEEHKITKWCKRNEKSQGSNTRIQKSY